MKKKLLVSILLAFACFNLAAYQVYLAPMAATSGIPMNPIKEIDNSHYTRINVKIPSDGNAIKNEADRPWLESSYNSRLPRGHFTDEEMIAIGGIKDLRPFEASHNGYSAKLEINAMCPDGFYFVSQSNPAYKRPFELYVIPMIKTYSGNFRPYTEYAKYGKERVLSETKYTVNFDYDMLIPEEFHTNYDISDYPHQIWFDMVLVLPGTIENDVLTLDGMKYPLTDADDYSAVVDITMKATIPTWRNTGNIIFPNWQFTGYVEQTETISIPFSGFYESNQKSRDPSSVSMYVHPVASAGNLDMRNYTRQQIANIEVMTVNPYDPNSTYACGIFLSSHEDPYTKGDRFRLTRENLPYDEPLTEYNSVYFDAYIVNSNQTAETRYDGTMAVDVNLNASNCKADPNLIVPEKKSVSNTHSKKVDYWYYSGNIFIEIEDNSAILMEAGRYTGNVYVHVMGF